MNIPSSWDVIKFDQINEFKSATINPDNFSLEKFDLYSVPFFPLGKPENLIGKEIGSTKQLVEPDDVLISKINPRINRVWKVAEKKSLRQIASSEWIVFRNKYLVSRYFLYYFRSPLFREKLCSDVTGVGGSLTRAQPKRVAEFWLPVAPLAEQRRIADKLDTTLARVDALNDRLARITPLLKRFRQSVLAAATSGRLTEDWREARGLNTSWQVDSTYGELPDFWSVLDIDKLKSEAKYSLAIGPFGSNLKTTDYTDAGVPLVFVREIRARSFGGNKTKFVSLKKADDLKAHKVTGGDILITKMGDPPGDVAIYPCDKEDAVITADCIKLKINKKIANNSYISFALESPSFKSVFMTAVAGVAQQKVSLARFRELPIVVPPLDEQTEIVRRVKTLFAFADRLEACLQSAQTAAERLTPALLAKAFRGELVPQDPNDEPATELLHRLREARAADTASKPKRGRKVAM